LTGLPPPVWTGIWAGKGPLRRGCKGHTRAGRAAAETYRCHKPVAGDANTVYVYGHDPIAQAEGTASPNYFLCDGHGSVRHLATSAGAITESYNYDG